MNRNEREKRQGFAVKFADFLSRTGDFSQLTELTIANLPGGNGRYPVTHRSAERLEADGGFFSQPFG